MIRYFTDKGWKEQVKKQIQLEKKIADHTSEPYYGILCVMIGVIMGMMCMIPAEEMIKDMENASEWLSVSLIYVLPNIIILDMYANKFLQIRESGKKVNIFTKYKNVPVTKNLLVTAKNILLFRRCLLYFAIYQGINIIVRLAIYSISGMGLWSIYNFHPTAFYLVIYIAESIRVRVYARKMCQ